MDNSAAVALCERHPNLACLLALTPEQEKRYEGVRTYFSKYLNPIGIEVEAENINQQAAKMQCHNAPFWNYTQDGSLKVNGAEFVSKPLSGRQIDYALYDLEQIIKNVSDKVLWSHRTSIHVHLNCSTLKVSQVDAIVALYGLFEDVYFSMVAPHRKGNSYCFPITDISPDQSLVKAGIKYCALNTSTLYKYCTIEFRAMHGNEDMQLLRRWIQMCVKLHYFIEDNYTKNAPTEILKQLTPENILPLFKRIYGATATLFNPQFVQESAEKNLDWALERLLIS